MQKVIDEVLEHMRNFIERPHPAFGGVPVCPFAAKARTEGKIKFVVIPILASEEQVLDEIVIFAKQDFFEVLTFVDPDKTMPIADLGAFALKIGGLIGSFYMVFTGHPEDQFSIAGVKVRQDPYPNFQVVKATTVEEARKKIRHSAYFARWTPEELERDGIK